MSDSKDFHAEVGQRLLSCLPPKAKQLFSEWNIQVRGVRQGSDEIPETNALILELPDRQRMEEFNDHFGERLFDLFTIQKALTINVIFIIGRGSDTCYSWMILSNCRFPILTRWRQGND